MELEDSDGNEILKIDVNGECVTEVIKAGDYVMIIHHDGKKEKTHPIFIIPVRSGGQQAQRIDTNQRLLKSERNIYARLINNLNSIITPKANAQTPTPAENLTTILNTNECQECNLFGVDLSGANLSEADLSSVDLSAANLTDVTLDDTIFTSALWCDGLCICVPTQLISV